jgi:hypothetical protein
MPCERPIDNAMHVIQHLSTHFEAGTKEEAALAYIVQVLLSAVSIEINKKIPQSKTLWRRSR